MRLCLPAIPLLIIFIISIGQRAALENGDSDNIDDNYDDQTNSVNTETREENLNEETTFIDESNLKGNESFEETNVTTVWYSLPEKDEAETKKLQILDPDECGDPPPVKNGMIFEGKQIRYEVGAKVTYACEFGYITDGSVHSSECLISDTTQALYWTDPETRCSPRSCGDPGYVEHAQRVGSVFTFPNKISFECYDGYTMRGYGTRYCQTSGTWSGNLPTCEPIFCDTPKNPENGKVSYSSFGYESELRYECDPGFILKNDQLRICSANGTWSGNEPACLEAQCDPPVAPEHGAVQVIGDKSSVGSRVLYTCDEGRVLVGSASSRCLDIGEWTFPTPRCMEPCVAPKVEHGKIGRYVGYYRRRFEELFENSKIEDGEELYLRCEPNYEPFGHPETEEKITCSLGEWKAFPVCEPAMCRGPPPPTPNADVARANRAHGGGVVYHCRQFAKKMNYGNTTCVFGTWKGVRPVCKDLRCSVDELSFPGLIKGSKKLYLPGHTFNVSCERGFNLTKENNQLKCVNGAWKGHLPPCLAASCNAEDLVESEGIMPDGEVIVLNGEHLKEVKCKEGYYSPSEKLARCSRGQWTVSGKLCEESSCTVHRIDNGGFSERVEKKRLKWNLEYDRWYEYPRLRLGGTRNPGSLIYVSCDDRHSFQGKQGDDHISVKCAKGKWDPYPVCLITGTPYTNEEKLSLEKDEKSNLRTNIHANSVSTTTQPLALSTQSRPDLDEVLDLKNPHQTPYPPCFCTYRGLDDNLVATVGTERLSYGDKVKNNDRIKFHCRQFGYSRLNGVSEIKCENCRSWHSSEFPECVRPQFNDTILQFEGDYTILHGGLIGVTEGKQLSVQCISAGINGIPKWSTTIHERLVTSIYRDQNGRFINVLTISKASSKHSGKYLCRMQTYRPSSFNIQVISSSYVKCSKFDDRDHAIHYDKDQALNSTAIFLCKDGRKKLDGPNIVTCLSNGQWSGGPPSCKMTCPIIEETEGMSISYTKGLYESSIAAFHCLKPRIRIGIEWTTCNENGEWKHPPAKCTLPNCSLDQLFDVVPANVVPVMENVASDTLPYNFTLRLTCENGLRLSGSDVAICGQDGKWQVSRVQCISGCGISKAENSDLIIEPDKSFYRFGESIALSCNPGYVLDSEVVRLMCLGNSWSENVPECRKE